MKQQLAFASTFFLAAMTVLPGWVSGQAATAPADDKPGYFAEQRHSSTSEVVSIDPATRMISLREKDEEPQMYKVGDDVRNLDQVKVGDRVKVDYYESTSFRVLPAGEMVNEDAATLARSQPGEKPGGIAAQKRTKTERVASVFPATKEVVTRDSKDRLTTWNVRDPKNLENVKSGDRLQFTYTSSLAVSVTPAPPSTAPAAPGAAPATAPAATPAPMSP